jgi:hypothetical protein
MSKDAIEQAINLLIREFPNKDNEKFVETSQVIDDLRAFQKENLVIPRSDVPEDLGMCLKGISDRSPQDERIVERKVCLLVNKAMAEGGGVMGIEILEGDQCKECSIGVMEIEVENCSCHISPPCSSCVDAPLVCNKCGFTHIEEKVNHPVQKTTVEPKVWRVKTLQQLFDELPDGVFGQVRGLNNGWGMRVMGKKTADMTREDVLDRCNVCKYGVPLFKKFTETEFIFTYSYD